MKITIQRSDLATGIAAVHRAMHTGGNPRLCGIRLATPTDAGEPRPFDIVATNGHWLARFRMRGLDIGSGGVDAVTLHASAVKPLLAWLKTGDDGAIEVDLAAATIGGVPFRRVTKADVDAIDDDPTGDAPFPPYDRTFPRASTRATTSPVHAWDHAYLDAVMRSFGALRRPKCKRAMALRFTFVKDALDPVVITTTYDERLTVLVMPVRL